MDLIMRHLKQREWAVLGRAMFVATEVPTMRLTRDVAMALSWAINLLVVKWLWGRMRTASSLPVCEGMQ